MVDDRPGRRSSYSPDPDDRDASQLCTTRDRPKSNGSSGVRLRCRIKDWPYTEIIRATLSRFRRLLIGLGRVSEHEVGSTEPACVLEWQVVNAEMSSIGSDCQRDIDAIVDQEQDAVGTRYPSQLPSQVKHGTIWTALVAELQRRDPAPDRRSGNRDEVTSDVVRIEHQVEEQSLLEAINVWQSAN
jgi:hypothetical protein